MGVDGCWIYGNEGYLNLQAQLDLKIGLSLATQMTGDDLGGTGNKEIYKMDLGVGKIE